MNKKLSSLRGVSRLLYCGLVFSVATFSQGEGTPSKPPAFSAPPSAPKKYSVAEIGALFERPTNALDLLKNLKLAMDKDLLLQQAFYNDANLIKFFSSTKVTWEKPDLLGNSSDKRTNTVRAKVTVDSLIFPRMTVKLMHSYWKTSGFNTSNGEHVPAENYASGQIQLQVDAVPEFTLHKVRQVFGTNAEYLDPHYSPHGDVQKTTDKGAFRYDTRGQSTGKHKTRGRSFQKETTFSIKFRMPPDPALPGAREPITEDDALKDIELHESIEWPSVE